MIPEILTLVMQAGKRFGILVTAFAADYLSGSSLISSKVLCRGSPRGQANGAAENVLDPRGAISRQSRTHTRVIQRNSGCDAWRASSTTSLRLYPPQRGLTVEAETATNTIRPSTAIPKDCRPNGRLQPPSQWPHPIRRLSAVRPTYTCAAAPYRRLYADSEVSGCPFQLPEHPRAAGRIQ
jgi:hypothetical protein